MESKKEEKKRGSFEKVIILQKSAKFVSRWLYLVMLFASLAYAVFVWNRYIINAEWSEERKNAYISEQSVFAFDRNDYQKAFDLVSARKEKLESGERFSGQDIFFPE